MDCIRPFVKTIGHGLDANYIPLPCGRCLACRVNYTRQWTQRLLAESYHSKNAYFLTLTYEDSCLPRDDNDNPCVCKRDIQLFIKRLRKHYPDSNIRYFLGSEYGEETLRPHYHAIFYNLPDELIFQPQSAGGDQWHYHDKSQHMINRKINDYWQKGFIEIDPINRQRAEYCAKYFVFRKDVEQILVPNFNLMSRKPGIGYQRIDEIKDKVRYYNLNGMLTDKGTYCAIPRYYKDKIYSKEEREELFNRYLNMRCTLSIEEIEFNRQKLQGDELEESLIRNMTFKNKKRKL
ncbi:replication initiator protein [Capybara microvirus Cap3_SP_612]|nr:replication initiator protein [Capybara microvirus Cap3_SP_612]